MSLRFYILYFIFFIFLQNIKYKIGAGGHRSHCLAHAKRTLYHLSYSPKKSTTAGFEPAREISQ